MKKFFALILSAAMVLGLASCGGQQSPAPSASSAPAASSQAPQTDAVEFEEMHITLAHPHPTGETDPVHVMATEFANYVTEKTGGKVTFDIVGDAVLGKDAEVFDGLNLGTTDMCIVANSVISGCYKPAQLLMLPFLFENKEQVHNFLDSDLITPMIEGVAESGGARILGIGDGGFRVCVNNVRPITNVSDFDSIKWRIVDNKLYLDTYSYLGANPTPMNGSEVFTALQNGTVDGCCFPVESIHSYQMHKIAKYIDMTNHMYTSWFLCMSEGIYKDAAPELQQIFDEAGKYATERQREADSANYDTLLDEIKAEASCEINENVDTSSMYEAVSAVYDEYRPVIGEEWFDECIAFIKG